MRESSSPAGFLREWPALRQRDRQALHAAGAMRRRRLMAALQKGHCGAWSGMLHTALAHAMHILQRSTKRTVSPRTADMKTIEPFLPLPARLGSSINSMMLHCLVQDNFFCWLLFKAAGTDSAGYHIGFCARGASPIQRLHLCAWYAPGLTFRNEYVREGRHDSSQHL